METRANVLSRRANTEQPGDLYFLDAHESGLGPHPVI